MSRVTRASLDLMLTDALRPTATAAPMPEELLRVPHTWVRDPRSVHSPSRAVAAGAVVTAAVVVTLAVLSVGGAFGERPSSIGSDDAPQDVGIPIESLDVEPRPSQVPDAEVTAAGPVVEVARGRADGRDFRFTVYRSESPDDVCIEFEWSSSAGAMCGALPGEGPTGGSFGGGAWSGGSHFLAHEVFGMVAPDVAEVWIETETGGRARAQLIPLAPAGINALLFFAFLPSEVSPSALVALDATGNELDRLDNEPDRLETPAGPDLPSTEPTAAPGP